MTEGTIKDQLGISSPQLFKQAFAKAVVDNKHAFTISEEEWTKDLVKAAIEACRGCLPKEVRSRLPFNFDNLIPNRQDLTNYCDDFCEKVIECAIEKTIDMAKRFGATQVSDGSSNIENNPLLVYGYCSDGGFLVQRC